jgi:hypothetical protein
MPPLPPLGAPPAPPLGVPPLVVPPHGAPPFAAPPLTPSLPPFASEPAWLEPLPELPGEPALLVPPFAEPDTAAFPEAAPWPAAPPGAEFSELEQAASIAARRPQFQGRRALIQTRCLAPSTTDHLRAGHYKRR